ncbi:hypothetical protein [Actinokineospora diospyrosa]|uniref:Uncharacterized protein n=1 Tax=Actinokineospora diospyrosa TaxID=103728 RepID=A0ABT1IP05_9PSEU|nr:hypothetical protein [Actinokineospora diospyrosa]MCP2274406.1 hypothetical protein [Actinokineospora diospyrosa]
MLSSPVWRGSPAFAFRVGLLLGGAITATVLVVVGSLARAPLPWWARWALVGAVLVLVALNELRVIDVRLPENRRLVPEGVFRLGRHLGPLQFGIEMGTGARTYLPSGLPYIAATAVLLTASVPQALVAGAAFGFGRALMTTANLNHPGDWDALWARHARLTAALLSGAFLLSLGTAAVATA